MRRTKMGRVLLCKTMFRTNKDCIFFLSNMTLLFECRDLFIVSALFLCEILSSIRLPNSVLFDYSVTPLHEAAQKGHQEIVRMLLDEAAHVDDKDNNGYRNYIVTL